MNLQLIQIRHMYLNEGAPSTVGEIPMEPEHRINKGNQLDQADVDHEEKMAQQNETVILDPLGVADLLSDTVYNDIQFGKSNTEEQTFDQKMRISQTDDEQVEFGKNHHQATISYQEKREKVSQFDQQIILAMNSSVMMPNGDTNRVSQTPVLTSVQGTIGKDFLNGKVLETQKQFGVYNSQDEECTERKEKNRENKVKDYDTKDNAEYEVEKNLRIKEQETVEDVVPEERNDVEAVAPEEKVGKDGAAKEKGDGASEEKEDFMEVAIGEREDENKASTEKEFDEKENEEDETPAHPKAILLVSSWRSGSSFLGELLALTRRDTFYRSVL